MAICLNDFRGGDRQTVRAEHEQLNRRRIATPLGPRNVVRASFVVKHGTEM